MKNLVMMLLLPIAFFFTSCCDQEGINLSTEEIKTIEKEVDARFQQMLKLAKEDNFDDFKMYIDKAATLAVAGYDVPAESVAAYTFKIFKSLADKDINILKNNYYVLSKTAVYQDNFARPVRTDTIHGFELSPPPVVFKYLSKTDAQYFKITKEEPGDETYITLGSDTTVYMKPVDFRFPIKTEKFTVIFIKNKNGWQIRHEHLSLGLKRSRVFNLAPVVPKK